MAFLLRDFRRNDFETLWAIDQGCFPPGIAYSRRELSAFIRRWGAFTLVGEARETGQFPETDGIAGFLVAQARQGMGHIITLDVIRAARRGGLGSQLIVAAEERLLAGGCRHVYLETAVHNRPAIAFYKRHGYELLRTEPKYYSDGADALVLAKDLLSRARAS